MSTHGLIYKLIPVTPRSGIFLMALLLLGGPCTPIETRSAEDNAATITGHILFTGVVPPNKEVAVREDQKFCGRTLRIQTIRKQQGGHGLHQAIVSLGGMKNIPERTAEVRSLRNEKCAFHDRINAVMKGDSLEVQNLDPILHNAHGSFGKRTILNVAQVPGGRPFRKIMKYSGQLVIKCDKHEFMQAHVMVFPHPYFSLTDETGGFRIDAVPPGRHRLTVWHETLGTLEKAIEVPAQGTVTVDFEFHE